MTDRKGHAGVPVAARHRGVRRWLPAIPLLLVSALLLAACQTSPSAPPTGGAPTLLPTAPVATLAPSVTPPTAPPIDVVTPAPTAATGAAACTVTDLKASHGLVEGATGSRIAEVLLVSNRACSVDAFPALGLRDSAGAALVGGASAGPGRIELKPAVAYSSNVRISNWCADEPSFPLTLGIVIDGQEVVVEGGSFPETGDLPPCNGDGGPILEGTAWVATP
ncbi:MAG TPA: hypothetical protein VM451_00950 [Candidatus Limnocylindria bacterium]|nr:hypothetical protein [Candidatus Limnocylindria bacterium]